MMNFLSSSKLQISSILSLSHFFLKSLRFSSILLIHFLDLVQILNLSSSLLSIQLSQFSLVSIIPCFQNGGMLILKSIQMISIFFVFNLKSSSIGLLDPFYLLHFSLKLICMVSSELVQNLLVILSSFCMQLTFLLDDLIEPDNFIVSFSRSFNTCLGINHDLVRGFNYVLL